MPSPGALPGILDVALGYLAANVLAIPIDFILFGLTLLGVALIHRHTFLVSVTGVAAIALHKILFTGFKTGPGLAGFLSHLGHEWVILINLLCLLLRSTPFPFLDFWLPNLNCFSCFLRS